MERINTKVITRTNGLTLVEWMDGNHPNRAWVTPDMIVSEGDASATVIHPAGGIPYGVDWSALISTQIDADEIEQRLKGAGVWTVEELQRNPRAAQGIISRVAAGVLQALLVNAQAQRS